MNEFNLFFDMDGLFFNFDGHFLDKFGKRPEDMKTKDAMWKLIAKEKNFFTEMPLLEGAADFYNRYMHLNPIFITHVPENLLVEYAREKIGAVQQHGFKGLVIPVPTQVSKSHYIQRPGDILVDDWGKNIREWEAAGGVGIKHTDFQHTIAEMEWILYRMTHPEMAVS